MFSSIQVFIFKLMFEILKNLSLGISYRAYIQNRCHHIYLLVYFCNLLGPLQFSSSIETLSWSFWYFANFFFLLKNVKNL